MTRRRRLLGHAVDTFTSACAVYLVTSATDGPLWYLLFWATVNGLLVWHLVGKVKAMRWLDANGGVA